MRTLLAITKAISDQNRVRILCALRERGELCVCQIHEFLGLAPSSTSKHLSILAGAGLVSTRKEGRWAYYSLAEDSEVPEDAAGVVDWLYQQAIKEKLIQQDRKNLQKILTYTPEELCHRQAQGIKCCSSAPEIRAEVKWQKDLPAR